jgi:Domain of unknown function (DUF4382)
LKDKEVKMKVTSRQTINILISILLLVLLTACGSQSGDPGVIGTGNLSVSLTDSSTEDYRAVYVTIQKVEVNPASGNWQTIATPAATYDLLELVNGVRAELGIASLTSGHFTQLRLILDSQPDNGLNILGLPHSYANYFIDQTNAIHELKVPSGLNTGIKIVQGFDINNDETTELLLDFNVMKSIVVAGNSGKYLLKPTIKILQTVDQAVLRGLVSAAGSGPPEVGIEGALVSAQVDNGPTPDAKDRVSIEHATITAADDALTVDDETGQYSLFLPAGAYNLVAYFTGFEPLCHEVSLTAGGTTTGEDFSLNATLTGMVQGTVDISNASVEQHATIDFRQSGLCSGDLNKVVNVKTVEVENGGVYTVELPEGTYQVVSSTSGKATQSTDVIVIHNVTSAHNIAF